MWFELGRIVPFAGSDAWFAADGAAYFDAAPGNPPTVPLLQVWACIALGRWDDALMNWPWWQIAVALALAVYGAMRSLAMSSLAALVVTFFVATLPLANVHVALAGYADLPLAAWYTCAALALLRGIATRDPRDAWPVALLAFACTQVKNPGLGWAATLVPGVIVALRPAHGLRIAAAGLAAILFLLAVLAQSSPSLLGYRLHLDFDPAWPALADNYLLLGSWNLLWYGAIAAALLAWRDLVSPAARPVDHDRRGRRSPALLRVRLSRRPGLGRRSDDPQSRHASSCAAAGGLCGAGIPCVRAALDRQRVCRRCAGHLIDRAPSTPMLELPDVTLCCIDTRNHALALRALARSREGTTFARALLLTDALPPGTAAPEGIEVVPIAAIDSRDAYSEFVLKSLLPHVATSHVLLVQWDGYVINPAAWDPAFLECDYIGATWHWHDDGMRVGNGGFSLRSRRLLQALQDPQDRAHRRRRHDHRAQLPAAARARTRHPLRHRGARRSLFVRGSLSDRQAVRLPWPFQLLPDRAAGRDCRAREPILR